MKKLLMAIMILSSSLYAQSNVPDFDTNFDPTNVGTNTEMIISDTRDNLNLKGYSSEMMNDLFGDENMYFPTTDEQLTTTLYIVDKLIENKQYEEADRTTLISLSNDAYKSFKNNLSVQTSLQNK